MTSRITRDNYDPARVLQAIRGGNLSIGETERLLEEACHALDRKDAQLNRACSVVANLHQDLIR